MRVSIRRLVQGLRVFRQFVPATESKKLRKQLRRVMKLSSAVRDYDIALQYLTKHGLQPEEIVARRLESKRALAGPCERSAGRIYVGRMERPEERSREH